jgi:hypothetical protein
VRGILPDAPVTVVNVQWFGSEALELTYKTRTDGPALGGLTPSAAPDSRPRAHPHHR